jgi:hypothetical protein
MRVKWTEDLPIEDLRNLSTELGSDFGIEIDETPRMRKGGTDLPSWVRFVADAPWWIKLLWAGAAVYFKKIIEEAAKSNWENRSKIISAAVSAAVGAGDRVKQFAVALANLRKHLAPNTDIEIALPFPDDYDGTGLVLRGADVDELAVQLAVFVHYLPALEALIRKENLTRGTIATGIQLALLPDLSLKVSWQDNASLEWQTRLLTIS